MEMSVAGVLWALLVSFVVWILVSKLRLWITEKRIGGNLPKGSYGWPIIGETIPMFMMDPAEFCSSRVKKYGKVFKTHVFGYPAVVVTDAEIAHAVLANPSGHLVTGLPKSAETLFGPYSLPFLKGEEHFLLHKMIQGQLFYDSIGPRVQEIEKMITDQIYSWEGKTVDLDIEFKRIYLDVTMHFYAGFGIDEDEALISEVLDLFHPFSVGLLSVPINLPGTAYYRAVKARRRVEDILEVLIEERKRRSASGSFPGKKDLITHFVDFRDKQGVGLKNHQIKDQLISVLFAGYDTTASTSSSMIGHLLRNPEVYKNLQDEHEEILRNKKPGDPLVIEDIKKMTYTLQVIHETLRLPGTAPFTLRKTLEDVEINGYKIPKGWMVVNLFSGYQQNFDYYIDPYKFDPSRFKEGKLPKAFTPFGGGRHICAGRELAKLKMKIVFHHLVTRFKLSRAWPDKGIRYYPVVIPNGGLKVHVERIQRNGSNTGAHM